MPPSPARSPTKRLTILSIAAASVVFHLWLAAKLSHVRRDLGEDEADSRELEGAEWKRLAGVAALLSIGRLWSLCSAGVAGVGIFGLLKDRPSFLRLFVLNSFLSLALDVLLCFLILLLLTLAAPSTASGHLGTTLCQVLSTSGTTSSSSSSSSDSSSFSIFSLFSLALPDLLGLSLEGCEDRFDGVLVSSLSVLTLVEALRAWAAVKCLRFYTAATTHRSGSGRRGRQPDPLSLPIDRDYREFYQDSPVELDGPSVFSAAGASPHQKRKRRDSLRRDPSASGSSSHGPSHSTRILLLPRPEDRAPPAASAENSMEVPLLALTASSPVRTSFPPSAQGAPSSERERRSGKDKGKVLVYAPVYMTVEEARTCGAQELVLHNRPSRSSSGHHSSSSSSTTAGARSRSSTIVPSVPSPPPSTPALRLDTKRSGVTRQDSEGSEVATPVAVRPGQQQLGIMEVLRGDLEDQEEQRRVDKGKRA